jgi:xanthine dehydrogenase accessory factor
MLNIADTLHDWCRGGRPFALATVVQVSGSAPLPVGTAQHSGTQGKPPDDHQFGNGAPARR